MTSEVFVGNVDQDQTVQNVQSDFWSKLSTFFFLINNWIVPSHCGWSVFSANEKIQFIFF